MRLQTQEVSVAHKSTAPTIVRKDGFLQDCKCWYCNPAPKPVRDGYEPHHALSSTGLGWDPISTLQSHAHITPLLYHELEPSTWPMVILAKSMSV